MVLSLRRTLDSPTILGAAVAGTTFRPAPSYTTLWDVTEAELLGAALALVALATPWGALLAFVRRKSLTPVERRAP